MKQHEKMAREHVRRAPSPSNGFKRTPDEFGTDCYLAGFRAAREMAAQKTLSERENWDRGCKEARRALTISEAAIRQLGEAEEGNPTRADAPDGR